MRAPFPTAFAIAFGLLVLIGYLVPQGFPGADTIYLVRSILVGWAVILAAVAALVGIFNLVITHLGRITTKKNPDYYSVLVVVTFVLTLGFGVYEYLAQPSAPQFQQAVMAVQVPIEAALMGLVVITLTFASVRLFQRRKGLMATVFVVSALVFLLLGSGLLAPLLNLAGLDGFYSLLQTLPVAGGRGILIGIALGSLTAGLRILLGADRPYSG